MYDICEQHSGTFNSINKIHSSKMNAERNNDGDDEWVKQ